MKLTATILLLLQLALHAQVNIGTVSVAGTLVTQPPQMCSTFNNYLVRLTNGVAGDVNEVANFINFAASTNAIYPKGIRTNFWLRNISGIRALPFYNDSNPTGGGTLISRQHFVSANHANSATYGFLRWFDTNGVQQVGYPRAYTNFGPRIVMPSGEREFVVCLLSNALPESVETVSVAGDSVLNGMCGTNLLAMMFMRKAQTQHPGLTYWLNPRVLMAAGSFYDGLTWSHNTNGVWPLPTVTISGHIEVGDSGWPIMLVNPNATFTLVGVHTGGGVMSCAYAADIKAAMDQLSDAAGQPRMPLTVTEWANNAVTQIVIP